MLISYIYIYIFEPKAEPHSNLVGKFEPESNLIVVEPEPCDITYIYIFNFFIYDVSPDVSIFWGPVSYRPGFGNLETFPRFVQLGLKENLQTAQN